MRKILEASYNATVKALEEARQERDAWAEGARIMENEVKEWMKKHMSCPLKAENARIQQENAALRERLERAEAENRHLSRMTNMACEILADSKEQEAQREENSGD